VVTYVLCSVVAYGNVSSVFSGDLWLRTFCVQWWPMVYVRSVFSDGLWVHDHSAASSVEFKNDGAIPPLSIVIMARTLIN
jgi:hypothetical protein